MSERRAAALRQNAVLLRLNPLVRLHWRAWDDEPVVFDEVSGGTYQIGPLDSLLLQLLESGPVDTSAVASEVALLAGETEARFAAAVEAAAAQLQTRGLIDIGSA